MAFDPYELTRQGMKDVKVIVDLLWSHTHAVTFFIKSVFDEQSEWESGIQYHQRVGLDHILMRHKNLSIRVNNANSVLKDQTDPVPLWKVRYAALGFGTNQLNPTSTKREAFSSFYD